MRFVANDSHCYRQKNLSDDYIIKYNKVSEKMK